MYVTNWKTVQSDRCCEQGTKCCWASGERLCAEKGGAQEPMADKSGVCDHSSYIRLITGHGGDNKYSECHLSALGEYL